MKKMVFCLGAIMLLAIGVLAALTGGIINLNSAVECRFYFGGDAEALDPNRSVVLSQDDFAKVRDALNHKLMWRDRPSCGFSDGFALEFILDNDEKRTVNIALDSCGIFQVDNGYLSIQDDTANQIIRPILDKYQ